MSIILIVVIGLALLFDFLNGIHDFEQHCGDDDFFACFFSSRGIGGDRCC